MSRLLEHQVVLEVFCIILNIKKILLLLSLNCRNLLLLMNRLLKSIKLTYRTTLKNKIMTAQRILLPQRCQKAMEVQCSIAIKQHLWPQIS